MVTSFFLPRYLSIESYGYYKVFQLYVNYLGIAHLGFVDGIYLKYGGREIRDIDADELLSPGEVHISVHSHFGISDVCAVDKYYFTQISHLPH